MNYSRAIDSNPQILDTFINSAKQVVILVDFGTSGRVIALFPEYKVSYVTDFFDTGDMFSGSDYEPIYIPERQEIKLKYEL